MHLQVIDKIVETMRTCLRYANGRPVPYAFVDGGLQFGEGDHRIRSEDELVTLRASLLLREAVEGDDDAPEGYS